MKQGAGIAMGVIAVALAAGGGYWSGHQGKTPLPQDSAVSAPGAAKKLLYYRNPMGLPDTSPTPKKDPMGMDYIAVYAGGADEEPATNHQIKVSANKVQQLGVRTEAAQWRSLDRSVRAAGRIEPDERRLYTIASKFEGYVERLHVNVTGQPVKKGQPLFEVYSPELVSAQREYAIAAQGVDALKSAGSETQTAMKQLADSSLQRLRNWDISDEQIKALTASGATQRTLTFRSPASGIVMEKKAVQGMRFMPGEMLYQIADLSAVWVIADVFEQDIGLVKSGTKVKVTINAYPGQAFSGTVTYVYPTLKAETRTVPIRVELANADQRLKPGMFAQVDIAAGTNAKVITIPLSAVIDSGTRQIVLIQQGEGRFEPREVKLGSRSDNHVEVRDGVQDGERVVVAANFLIDAESNLKAAIGGFGDTSPPKAAGHQAQGAIDDVDVKAGTLTLSHAPVASLKWPAMTMEFKVANASLFKGLSPGAQIAVEFVERQPGEWVITGIKPLSASAHNGH